MAAKLRALGARVIEAPTIRIEPLAFELPDLAGYDVLVLTSPNAVEALFLRAHDARALAGPRIAVIGPGTADALRTHGVVADIVPDRAVGEALAETLAALDVRRVLIARAEQARDVVPDVLRAARRRGRRARPLPHGARADVRRRPRRGARRAEWLTFTSASSARFFHAAAGTLDGPRLASIGPVTSAALRELGYEPDLEATDHTPAGLVTALVSAAGRG